MSPTQEKKENTQVIIKQLFYKNREVYGSPRIKRELDKKKIFLAEKTVANYMRELGLSASIPFKYKTTTNSNHDHLIYPNLLMRNFNTDAPNLVWVADITYIWTREGWLYLATVMDLFNRKIVGFNIDSTLSTELPLLALQRALTLRSPDEGLIHHSDQGSQYASKDYVDLLKEKHCKISMSRRGDCYDNACIESFHSTIKKELIYRKRFVTRDEAKMAVLEYIVSFYNEKRIHSTLNYLSPNDFERKYLISKENNAQQTPATFVEEQLSF